MSIVDLFLATPQSDVCYYKVTSIEAASGIQRSFAFSKFKQRKSQSVPISHTSPYDDGGALALLASLRSVTRSKGC